MGHRYFGTGGFFIFSPMDQECLAFLKRPFSELEESYPAMLGEMILRFDCFGPILDAALGARGSLPFRAAWGLAFACAVQPERFEPHFGRFIADFPRVRHESVRREYCKILMRLMREQGLTVSDGQAVRVAEAVCEWITDPQAKIACKVNCLDLLLLLIPQVEWARDALGDLLERERPDASPGMVCRIRKIERELRRGL